MHFNSYIVSLKLSWFRNIFYSKNIIYGLLSLVLDLDSGFGFGTDYVKSILNGICNLFWKETLMTFSDTIDSIRKPPNT